MDLQSQLQLLSDMSDDHWAHWVEYLTFDEGLWAEQYWEMCWTLEVWPEYLERLGLHRVSGSLGEYQGEIDLHEVSYNKRDVL